MKKISNAYDKIIETLALTHFPELVLIAPFFWRVIKAQIWQESRMNPQAVSPVGAKGLMQLMPKTAEEVGVEDVFGPVDNIVGGIRYLQKQYHKFGEIPDKIERVKFSLAAYNGGRGYVNVALALAREACGQPSEYRKWKKAGKPEGDWQKWDYTKKFLSDDLCKVSGRNPDHKQMTDYVDKIFGFYKSLIRRDDLEIS